MSNSSERTRWVSERSERMVGEVEVDYFFEGGGGEAPSYPL